MTDEFKKIANDFEALKAADKKHTLDLHDVGDIAKQSLRLLQRAERFEQGRWRMPDLTVKRYDIFKLNDSITRPINRRLFITEPDVFWKHWQQLNRLVDSSRFEIRFGKLNETLYTAAMSFAAVYDLYKAKARKTPGTYLEMLIGALIGKLTRLPISKHTKFRDKDGDGFSVPTDLVVNTSRGQPTLVIATKITTRERIVQPFVHQLLLSINDNEMEERDRRGYKSILMCISEMKRTDPTGVEEICVPKQLPQYQKHLGQLSGLYYADVPGGYLTQKVKDTIDVGTFVDLFSGDLRRLLNS